MLEPAVDRLRGAVGCAWSVEVGQHVLGAAGQGPAELSDLDQRGRHAFAKGVDDGLHRLAAVAGVGVAVGGDDPLVGTPGGLHLDVVGVGEQHQQSFALGVGQQRFTGVQRPAGSVQRVAPSAARLGSFG